MQRLLIMPMIKAAAGQVAREAVPSTREALNIPRIRTMLAIALSFW